MSQHDLSIANQGFPAFRSDLNDALQALGSMQSGTTAPSTTYANQLWYDTTNNIVKMRNEDNDAWISLFTLDQSGDLVSAISAATGSFGALSATGNVTLGDSSSDTVTVNGATTFATQISAPNTFGFKNRIINGAMMIDQRNAGASVTPNASYTLDRWAIYNTQTSKLTVQQNAGSVTPPAGFANYLGVTSSSAYSISSSDIFELYQPIEGYNVADLAWGTANAQTITLSFWVRSSLTGTFGGALGNSGFSRSYPFTYTISSSNTWTQISITIAGDTSGTWLKTNGQGLVVNFGLGVGSTYSGAAGSWSGSTYYSATGATSVVGTNGATFYITGVQLEKGSTATSFDYRPYGTELALCQRYYQKLGNSAYAAVGIGRLASTRNFTASFVRLNQNMRTSPTVSFSNLITTDREGYDQDISSIGSSNTSIDSVYVSFNHTAIGTAGQPSVIAVKNGTSGYIDFSAEL